MGTPGKINACRKTLECSTEILLNAFQISVVLILLVINDLTFAPIVKIGMRLNLP